MSEIYNNPKEVYCDKGLEYYSRIQQLRQLMFHLYNEFDDLGIYLDVVDDKIFNDFYNLIEKDFWLKGFN